MCGGRRVAATKLLHVILRILCAYLCAGLGQCTCACVRYVGVEVLCQGAYPVNVKALVFYVNALNKDSRAT